LRAYCVPFLMNMECHFFRCMDSTARPRFTRLAEKIAGDERQTVLFYVGDYDPSGMYMSEIDLPARLRSYGAGDFSFERIALLESDLSDLPDFEAKKTDPRYKWFVDNYGKKAWELDAMDPNELRDR
jgi:hypothetical protein